MIDVKDIDLLKDKFRLVRIVALNEDSNENGDEELIDRTGYLISPHPGLRQEGWGEPVVGVRLDHPGDLMYGVANLYPGDKIEFID